MDQVDRVMVSFEESRKNYPHPEKVRVVGMPVRSEFFFTGRQEARKQLGLDDRPLVVSFWGSLGAREMNKMIALKKKIAARMQSVIGLQPDIKIVEPRSIERSMGKAKHVIDKRKLV